MHFFEENEKCPLISVIIPVYNVVNYIGRCLDSIIANTYKHLEIICVNDGSSDGSEKVLLTYKSKDTRIRVINQNNAGVSAARNAGVATATGDFIAYIDADDWIHNMYFEALVYAWKVTGRNAEVIFCGNTRVYANETDKPFTIDQLTMKQGSWALHQENSDARKNVTGKIYISRLAKKVSFPINVSIGEDTAYNLCLLAESEDAKTVLIQNAPLYYYFQRGDSAIHTFDSLAIKKTIEYILGKADSVLNSYAKAEMGEAGLKFLLMLRYYRMYQDRKCTESKKMNNSYAKRALNYLKDDSLHLSKYQKFIKYKILWQFPIIYRVFRDLRDRSLLEWDCREMRTMIVCKFKRESYIN